MGEIGLDVVIAFVVTGLFVLANAAVRRFGWPRGWVFGATFLVAVGASTGIGYLGRWLGAG